ncbi:cell envelope integrity protein TolA [Noviherbaspirillum sp. 17J57-3]|uniref:Cell envelope integrity protein TolA n=2 Tax=Noviherbaspirillum galbum TaxID=2709383 RepID=A0A6B3SHX7_9BURK|nr:cell envelope integrity protein TolA [Noviherbaspirillum galbum]
MKQSAYQPAQQPYAVPPESGRWRAIVLALLMHLFLVLFLWVGIRWQNDTPQTIEAEVWSPQVREAAPTPPPPVPEEQVKAPEPKPEPEPRPVVKAPPPKAAEDEPEEKPDIALEQEKKRRALDKKRQEEEIARIKQKRQEEAEKLAKAKEREELLKKEKLEKEKAEKERLAKLEKEKEKAEKAEKDKAEKEKLAKLEKEKKEKAEKAEAKRRQDEANEKLLAKSREEEMRRLSGAVGPGGSGDAPKAQGPRGDATYVNTLRTKIRGNTSFIPPADIEGNPTVEYRVDLLPDGSVKSIKKLRSSGVSGFDEAVERAIRKSEPFPADKSTGKVPSDFTFKHTPKDL